MPTIARSNEAARWNEMGSHAFSVRASRFSPPTDETGSVSTVGMEHSTGYPFKRDIWENIGSSRVRAAEADQRMLERFYHLRDSTEILRFLSKEKPLFPYLLRMYPALWRHFGTRRIYLEVVADPEFEDERLGAFVAVDYAADEALELLGKFDEEWWPGIPSWLEKSLIVSVEFE